MVQFLHTRGPITVALSYQILKSGNSAGANYEEADDGSSSADTRAKRRITLRELKETHFRLRVLRHSGLLLPEQDPLIDENEQLIRIVATVIRNSDTDGGENDAPPPNSRNPALKGGGCLPSAATPPMIIRMSRTLVLGSWTLWSWELTQPPISSDCMNENPYAADLGNREPLKALAETPWQIEAIVKPWSDTDFERSYAAGKWSARRLLVHLAQTELALGSRMRFALSQEDYAAQSLNQDEWLPVDDHLDARTALTSYLAMRQMNLPMWRGLSDAQKNRTFTHPEYGTLNVWWVAAQMAGHDIHHLRQFEKIAAARDS